MEEELDDSCGSLVDQQVDQIVQQVATGHQDLENREISIILKEYDSFYYKP